MSSATLGMRVSVAHVVHAWHAFFLCATRKNQAHTAVVEALTAVVEALTAEVESLAAVLEALTAAVGNKLSESMQFMLVMTAMAMSQIQVLTILVVVSLLDSMNKITSMVRVIACRTIA